MNSTLIIGILGGAILVGFFAYNVYDCYIKKDTEDTNEDTRNNSR